MKTDVIAITTDVIDNYTKMIDVVKLNAASIEAQSYAEKFIIAKDEDELKGIDFLSTIKKRMNEIESLRKEKVQPFNDLVKRINTLFKPITESFGEAEGLIKSKILDYKDKKEKVRLQEIERQRKEYEAKLAEAREKELFEGKKTQVDIPMPIMPESKTIYAAEGSVTVKKLWRFNLIDKTKVPIDLMMVNEVAVNDEIRLQVKAGQMPVIAGLEIYQKSILSG